MKLASRGLAAVGFGCDLLRAAAMGARQARRRCAPPPADAADEVHLLVEGDAATGLSPAARYRALQYVPLLEQLGMRCHVWPSRPAKYFSATAAFQRAYARWPRLAMLWAHASLWRQRRNRRADFRSLAGRGVVLLQRDLLAEPRSRLEHELPLWNRHIVLDFDDAIFVQPPWARAPGSDGIDAVLRDKIARLCQLATAVVVANPYLAAFARQHNQRVHVVPTALCTGEFRPAAAPVRHARPVIGWAGTSGNLWYLRQIGPALQRLAARTDFVLRVVCNRVAPEALAGLPPRNLELVEWRHDDEVARLQQLDIGIMPLAADGWAEGKAGFKMVQYMACGVPFVASPVGANEDTGGLDGECGRYASTDDEWVQRLGELLAEPARRAELGRRGRERAVARFDRAAHARTLAAILREASRA